MSVDQPESNIAGPLQVKGKLFCLGGAIRFLKGVTFGPFPPGTLYGDEARGELERIRDELGANAVRFLEPPPLQWLHDCAEFGLHAFVTISWNQHADFIDDRINRRNVEIRVRDVVDRFSGHPAVAGYFIADEIEATLVRYLGPKRVIRCLEELIDLGRSRDPGPLFAYANSRRTEFVIPENQDFLAFNLDVEERDSFREYLFRLHNIAGNHPVLISGFGADSNRFGDEGQAEMLRWSLEEIFGAGAAGAMVSSWSDHWLRRGEVTGEAFGLTDGNREWKKAFYPVRNQWSRVEKPFDGVDLEEKPRFSVIVCTCREPDTLVPALESLVRLDYPDYEIIVVNDGNDDGVRELVREFDEVRHIGIPRGGLGRARNVGAGVATGEILAFTDDDCVVDPDWLNWLALAFASSGEPGCVGGPNIPPPPEFLAEACIAAAPGGAVHVLVSDREAEMVPGCNLAVKKRVFEAVEGFREVFRRAGDDVDFCWRLAESGYGIGFHPGAHVWHRRRGRYSEYLKQQIGYGRAEARLKRRHLKRFRDLGGARWRGTVYEGPLMNYERSSDRYHHGRFGNEPFQLVYPDERIGLSPVFTHAAYVFPMILLGVIGIGYPLLLGIAAAGCCLTVAASIRVASRAEIVREFDSVISRFIVAWLVLFQGIVRSAMRMEGAWGLLRPLPFVTKVARTILLTYFPRFGNAVVLRFWNESGRGREVLLREMPDRFPGVVEDASGERDFLLENGFFFRSWLTTVTEKHRGEHRLTRARIDFSVRMRFFSAALVGVLGAGLLFSHTWWLPALFAGAFIGEWLVTALRWTRRIGEVAREGKLQLVERENHFLD